jgi:predicted enzyme related to lactoylglutathione lyase
MDKVQHFEIPVDDIDRAKYFYGASFGWKTADWPMADGSTYVGIYTGPTDNKNMIQEKGFINGGMFKRGGNFAPTAPVITPVVQDIDATIEKIKAAGGEVVQGKTEIPGMGYYGYVKDTEGNTIGIFQEMKKVE